MKKLKDLIKQVQRIQIFVYKCIFSLFFLFSPLLLLSTSVEVSGDINSSTTWSADTIKITGDVHLRQGGPTSNCLTINPGVVVVFQGHYKLRIEDQLIALGTETDSIIFTINDTTGFHDESTTNGAWEGIYFYNTVYTTTVDTSKMAYCRIEYVKTQNSGEGGAIDFGSNGIYLLLSNSLIKNNYTTGYGGGIYMNQSNSFLSIINNTFRYNTAGYGGGICIRYSAATITDNLIEYNTAENDGGGISYISDGNDHQEFTNNVIKNNTAAWYGGGANVSECPVLMIDNIFDNNSATSGGGLYLYEFNDSIINNLVINNTASDQGGGIEASNMNTGTKFRVINTTIADNQANGFFGGGGLYVDNSNPVFKNSILYGNSASSGSQVYLGSDNADPDFFHCDIEGGSSAFYGYSNFSGSYTNNLDTDPLFVGTGDAPFDLQGTSPCINAGVYDFTTDSLGGVTTDLRDSLRILNDTIDIGAYEERLYVPCDPPANQVTGISFGSVTDSSIILAGYNEPADGADGYTIYINKADSWTAPNEGEEPSADTVWRDTAQQCIYFGTSTTPNVNVTGLDNNTIYYFKVYAYNNCSSVEKYETTGAGADTITNIITTPPSSGDGSSGSPYQIATLGNLNWLSQSDSVWDKHFIQVADINASDTRNWNVVGEDTLGFLPIGNNSTQFIGNYNGKGHIIDSLFINREVTNNIGLFGRISSSVIDSLCVEDANITGDFYVGALVGASENNSHISNSNSSGTVYGLSYVGGIVGYSGLSNISECYSIADVWGGNRVGGLGGHFEGMDNVSNSYSHGDVNRTTGSSDTYLGAFIGYFADNSTVEFCYSTGSVSYADASDPTDKGFIGNASAGTFTNNFWDSEASNQSSATGANGKITEEMKTASTFLNANWDFMDETANGTSDYWGINSGKNDGYPFLEWQAFENLLAPIATTQEVTDISYFTATGNGTITLLGTSNPSSHGVCWSTSENPTVLDDTTDLGDTSSTGAFVTTMTGLSPNTTYYVRSYAINDVDTSYGEQVSFTTTDHFNGSGTEADPYEISSLTELEYLSEYDDYWGKHFIQTVDIDASETSTWNSGLGFIPIGTSTKPFSGSYNGKGYTVDTLFINRAVNNIGLFGYADGAEIDSLGLIGADITGHDNVGAVVGYNVNSSVVSHCYSTGDITGHGYVGGVVGFNITNSTVSNCYSTCNISVSYKFGGGLVGYNNDQALITNCYSMGDVTRQSGSSQTMFAGFLGCNYEADITYCYSMGSVYYEGTTNPTDKGFIGSTTAGIQQYNFCDTTASNQSSGIGASDITTEAMQTKATFLDAGWDFMDETSNGTNDYWGINSSENGGYPFLKWQGFVNQIPPVVTTQAVTDIEPTTANGNGNITDLGTPNPTAHGVCWNTWGDPNLLNTYSNEGSASTTGDFTSGITGLLPVTTYYLKAYAINDVDTVYGDEVSFTTPSHFSGSGTEGDPYQISSLEDLKNLSENDCYWSDYFIQTADINAAETESWNSGAGWIHIGKSSNSFQGNYNGDGHIVDSLFINRPWDNYTGLFGEMKNGKISNLGVTNVNISGGNFTGTLVATVRSSSVVENCYSTGIVSGELYTGGLVGYAGYSERIENSYSTCDVSGTEKVGGFVGYNNTSDILNCYSLGDARGNLEVGGFVGRHSGIGPAISNAYSHGNATRNSGQTDTSFGGFIGYADEYSKTVSNCYSTGSVVYEGATNPTDKGFVGVNVGGGTIFTNNFWDTETSQQTSNIAGGANGKTTAEMQDSSTFTSSGWDFYGETIHGTDDDWFHASTVNNDYPALSWQANIWDGTAWSKSTAPGDSTDAVIYGHLTTSSALNCRNLVIKPGVQFTANHAITVNEDMALESESSGTASMLDNGNIAVSGNSIIELYQSSVTTDPYWHYATVPVDISGGNITSEVFGTPYNKGGTDYYASYYDEATQTYQHITNNFTLLSEQLRGYAIPSDTANTLTFVGNIVTGNPSITPSRNGTGTYEGFNLCGNPYPSGIDLQTTSTMNGITATNLVESVWIREDGNFLTYNWVSGTGGTGFEDGILPPMQSMWIRVAEGQTSGTLGFTNDARVHDGDNVYKNYSSGNNILRLFISRNGYTDEYIMGFYQFASNSFDKYDSEKMFTANENYPQLYSILEGRELAINGLNASLEVDMIIPLGIRVKKTGNYKLSVKGIDALELDAQVFFVDKQKGDIINLEEQVDFEINMDSKGTINDRFELRIMSTNDATGINENSFSPVKIFTWDGNIRLSSTEQFTGPVSVEVYNLLGQKLVERQYKNLVETRTINLQTRLGYYIVSVKTCQETITEKVLLR